MTDIAASTHLQAQRQAAWDQPGRVSGLASANTASSAAASIAARSIERRFGTGQDHVVYDAAGRWPAPQVATSRAGSPAVDEGRAVDDEGAEGTSVDGDVDAAASEASASTDAEVASSTDIQGSTTAAEPTAAAPTSRGAFVFTVDEATVQIEASDSADDNRIVYSFDGFQTYGDLGVDNSSLEGGTSVAMGKGTRMDLGIINAEGKLLRAGVIDADTGLDPARITPASDGTMTIAFDDRGGGGDGDYNDAVVRVSGLNLAADQVADVSTDRASTDLAVEPAVDVLAASVAPDERTSEQALAQGEMNMALNEAVADRNRQLLAGLYGLVSSMGDAGAAVEPSGGGQADPWSVGGTGGVFA